jgi:type VI secretion system secreted protein Hcp
MPIFMKYGAVKGAVTASGHEGWVELNSFQWEVDRTISSPTGGSSGREFSPPSIREIAVTKPTDIATVALLREFLVGGAQDVSIDFCKTDQGTLTVYLAYTLNDTVISTRAISSGGDLPEEQLSLSFTKFQCVDSLPGAGSGGSPDKVGYDVTTGRVS